MTLIPIERGEEIKRSITTLSDSNKGIFIHTAVAPDDDREPKKIPHATLGPRTRYERY